MGAAKRRRVNGTGDQGFHVITHEEQAIIDELFEGQARLLPNFFATLTPEERRTIWITTHQRWLREQGRNFAELSPERFYQSEAEEWAEVEKRLAQERIDDLGYYETLTPELRRAHRVKIHRAFVEERARAIVQQRKQEEGADTMAEAKVRFYKNGGVMGIQTSALDERDFIQECATGLATMIDQGQFMGDWQFQFEQWLPQIVDIVCKLRGYKAESVHERRVLSVGYPSWELASAVYPSENGDVPAAPPATDTVPTSA